MPSKPRWRSLRTATGFAGLSALTLTLTLAALGSGCGKKDKSTEPGVDPRVPQTWSGVWELKITPINCVTQDTLPVQTLCRQFRAGRRVADEIPFEQIASCPGGTFTAGDSTLTFDCIKSTTISGCTIRIDSHGAARLLHGDSLSGTVRTTFDFTPDLCQGSADLCNEFVIRGVRLPDSTICN